MTIFIKNQPLFNIYFAAAKQIKMLGAKQCNPKMQSKNAIQKCNPKMQSKNAIPWLQYKSKFKLLLINAIPIKAKAN
jgi:hypothetical protein